MSPRHLTDRPALYIFHVGRAKPRFFYPFKPGREFISQTEGFSIHGRYGKEPRVEAITLLRGDLYRLAESAVKQWVFELRFIPRFLISSAVFLFAYFFASFVIRDPLPVIDELLIAGAAFAVSYLLIGKRFLSSRAAEEKRGELHTVIDGIAFSESDFVRTVEDLLGEFDSSEPAKLLRIYNAAGSPQSAEPPESLSRIDIRPEWGAEAEALDACLKAVFQEKRVKGLSGRLRKKAAAADRPLPEKTLEALRRLIAGTRVDFPLFVLYAVLRGSLESSSSI
ncbi:MAG: hypothetical protein LBT68_01250 [Spirochaetales bacterium]|jgi:hypothetical protein|nr:hypothetical protein [Spirochaetales bacterium]